MVDASAPAPAPRHDHVLEGPRRLSQSLLWGLQRTYYEQRGPSAWSTHQVPWFVTSNGCLARAYAEVIDAFLRDVAAGQADPTAAPTVHLVEVGAGHGRLGFLLLEQLTALAQARAELGPRAPWRYVMTDVAESNLAACAAHPALRPHLEAGRLDLARFDAEADTELHLRQSGVVLAPAAAVGPIVVIANYVFDSLRHDAFRVDAGVVSESLAALHGSAPEPDLGDPALLERIELVYQHAPIAPGYYGDPALDAILDEYQRTLHDTVVTVPVGPLACLRHLRALAHGPMLLLSADKGDVHPDELLRRLAPQPVVHGSFSLTVNYHAIATWVRHLGGQALPVTPRPGTVVMTGYLLDAPPPAVARTAAAFATHVEAFGPMDFLLLQDELRPADRPLGLAAALALLRFSDWDPSLFYRVVDRMLPQLDDAGADLRRETRRALGRVWARYYHLGGTQDLPFEIARVWQRLGLTQEAMRMYEQSIALFGDSPVTQHNLGLCLYDTDQRYPEALAAFERSLALDPGYGPSLTWKIKTEAELRGA